MVNLSPSAVAQHLQVESPQPQPQQDLGKQPQNFQLLIQRFHQIGEQIVRHPNIGEQIMQHAQAAFHPLAQPNIGEQILQQAQAVFHPLAHPGQGEQVIQQAPQNIAEAVPVQARVIPVVDIHHVLKSGYTVEGGPGSISANYLTDVNDRDGKLLADIMKSTSRQPVTYDYYDWNYLNQYNIFKRHFGSFNNNPNHFLSNHIAVPQKISHIHHGLGFQMPISNYINQQINTEAFKLKVYGQDPTIYVPDGKRLNHVLIPINNPPITAKIYSTIYWYLKQRG